MCSVQTLTVGILAGGRGNRLGGRDKGMLVVDGEPFIAQLLHSVDRNLRAVPELNWVETVINCPRNSAFYRHYANRLVCDRQLHGGPGAGIAALLAACTTDWLLVLACDHPHLPVESIDKLWRATVVGFQGPGPGGNPGAGSYATDQGRHTPCMLINAARVVADTSQPSLLQTIENLGLTAVDIPGSGVDVDTPIDLTELGR